MRDFYPRRVRAWLDRQNQPMDGLDEAFQVQATVASGGKRELARLVIGPEALDALARAVAVELRRPKTRGAS